MKRLLNQICLFLLLAPTLAGCAHLSELPGASDVSGIGEATCLRTPAPHEIEAALKSNLNSRVIFSIEYSAPRRVYWGRVSDWRRSGKFFCGSAVPVRLISVGSPNMPASLTVFFQAAQIVQPGILNAPIETFIGGGKVFSGFDGKKMFVLAPTTDTTNSWSQLQINGPKLLELKEAAKKRATIKAAIESGRAICLKLALSESCIEDFTPADFYRGFGSQLTNRDRRTFYNAWRLRKNQLDAEAAKKQKAAEQQDAWNRSRLYNAQINAAQAQQRATNVLLLNGLQRSFMPTIYNANCMSYGPNTGCTIIGR
jgi:hypothetical protein